MSEVRRVTHETQHVEPAPCYQEPQVIEVGTATALMKGWEKGYRADSLQGGYLWDN